jgi:hypothetical protein
MTVFLRNIPSTKNYLCLLHVSLILAAGLLSVLILSDIRLNTLGEPFGEYLMAISIAISKLSYGVHGLAGLEQVLEVLKQIPNASLVNADGASYEGYRLAINQAIKNATMLENINPSRVHAFTNDLAYLYFVIAAFSLFGISIESLSYLWLAIFLSSIACFLRAYRNSIPNLLYLWCLIVSVIFVVISNPGVGTQLHMLGNQRFLPVLGLVPLLHIIVGANKSSKSLEVWLLLLIQVCIFVFVLLARALSQWMLIAMFFAITYLSWSASRALRAKGGNVSKGTFLEPLVKGGAVAMLVVAIFLIAKSAITHSLHEEYKQSVWARAHIVWYGVVIGLTTDSVLRRKYVCSDEVLTDQLMGFRQMQCDNAAPRHGRLIDGVFAQPRDMDAYQAAIRILNEQGVSEQLGADTQNRGYFNVRWDRLEELMRETFFRMLQSNPFDVAYMYLVVKPLKYLKEMAMYAAYFSKGVFGAKNFLGVCGIVAILLSLHVYLSSGFRKIVRQAGIDRSSEVEVSSAAFILVFIASLAPSIIFYSQSHTIAESVASVLALIVLTQITLPRGHTSLSATSRTI